MVTEVRNCKVSQSPTCSKSYLKHETKNVFNLTATNGYIFLFYSS